MAQSTALDPLVGTETPWVITLQWTVADRSPGGILSIQKKNINSGGHKWCFLILAPTLQDIKVYSFQAVFPEWCPGVTCVWISSGGTCLKIFWVFDSTSDTLNQNHWRDVPGLYISNKLHMWFWYLLRWKIIVPSSNIGRKGKGEIHRIIVEQGCCHHGRLHVSVSQASMSYKSQVGILL